MPEPSSPPSQNPAAGLSVKKATDQFRKGSSAFQDSKSADHPRGSETSDSNSYTQEAMEKHQKDKVTDTIIEQSVLAHEDLK